MQNKYDFNMFKKTNKLHHAETHCVEMQGKKWKTTHAWAFFSIAKADSKIASASS
jgi:hypothetical protein